MRLLLVLCLLVLPACGASTVRLRIVEQTAGGDLGGGEDIPVAGARVRAVLLEAGTIPLPLNERTLREMLTRQETVAVTNADGVARLSLIRDRSQLIEVEGPMSFTGDRTVTARWLLTPAPESALLRVGTANEYRAFLSQ